MVVITDYTLAQLNLNIYPTVDDLASAGSGTILALFDRFNDCDLGVVTADHAAAEVVIAPFFNDATTLAMKTSALEYIFSVIHSAAATPASAVLEHDTPAFNADKKLPRCILFRFAHLARFDLAYAGNFLEIKTSVKGASDVMDDLFFDKARAQAQLVRVANAQDDLEGEGLLNGLESFSTRPEASSLLSSKPLVDMFAAKVFLDPADFMQKFLPFCASQCGWTFSTAGIADASTMASIMVCMNFDYTDFPFPSTVSADARWSILSFFYSRYMLRSERAFEALQDLEWPGVHPLAVKLGKLCAMKSERFTSGAKTGMRPTPLEALKILFTGIGEYITHSDNVYDLQHRLFLKLQRGGLAVGEIGEAIRRMVTTTKAKPTLTPAEFMVYFPLKAAVSAQQSESVTPLRIEPAVGAGATVAFDSSAIAPVSFANATINGLRLCDVSHANAADLIHSRLLSKTGGTGF